VLRIGRGFAPTAIPVSGKADGYLALGGHLKNTVALGVGRTAFVSAHIGDLESPRTRRQFRKTVRDLESLTRTRFARAASDLHPDYASSRFAERCEGLPIRVQHHYAHIRSVLADNRLDPPVLGVVWDGGGAGGDGTVWGGEFLVVTKDSWRRVAHLDPFVLPGGEKAIQEPWRMAVSLMVGAGMPPQDLGIPAGVADEKRVQQVASLARQPGAGCPMASSVGRLFDAVAAMTGIRYTTSFEGQAAMELERELAPSVRGRSYRLGFEGADPIRIDWRPMIREIAGNVRNKGARGLVTARFHETLIEALVEVARRVGLPTVAMSGGCFQNRYLTERAIVALRRAGFQPYWHHRLPPNDGGLSLGQLASAAEGLH